MREYIVVVKFEIVDEKVDFFLEEVIQNAKDSLTEVGCRRFDVSIKDNVVFLYEIYNSEDDFNKHLETKHFNKFNETTSSYVAGKTVEIFNGVAII